MRKIVFITLLTSLLANFAFAQTLPITNGLAYLQSTQTVEGYWGDSAEVPYNSFLDTCTVAETLKHLNDTGAEYNSAIQWVNSTEVDNNDYLFTKMSVLAQAGFDVSAIKDYLLSMKNDDGGWGVTEGFFSDVKRTALALQALKAVNHPDLDTISSALFYLTYNQNADGGFSAYAGDDSSVYMTANVLQSLIAYDSIFDIQDSINKAAAYLLTKQNPDGSSGEGTVYETALSFIALIESGPSTGSGLAQSLQNAIAYLTSTQLPNGSWNDDPYSTALALRALANVKPNLSISSSDITFSNPAPTVGETITITATVHNTGLAQADNISVQFYDGDPDAGGILIGETAISSIPAYDNSSTNLNWTVPTATTSVIYAVIDPLNAIDELYETDNRAAKGLASATLPDLSITYGDINFTPSSPEPAQDVIIRTTIRNNGETTANNVSLRIYDGDPMAGGIMIGNLLYTTIPNGNSATLDLTTNFTAGRHDIYVIVDEDDTIIESKEANNAVTRTLYVGIAETIDLLIYPEDITFSPAYPTEGDAVILNAAIHNEGTLGASNVMARFYLGDPDAGGTQIGSDTTIPLISARGTVIVSTAWDSTDHAGNNDIYVVIDPDNIIAEDREENNRNSKTLIVEAMTGPDLTLSQADINYMPVSPASGDTLTITANIRNTGIQDANNVPVGFSISQPGVDGTTTFSYKTVASIAINESAVVQATLDTSLLSGAYEIYVTADPLNEISEMDELNNIAHLPITITAPQGPDLTITSIDTANLMTDTQSLQVSGSINITLENRGNHDTVSTFTITAYEDLNSNGGLDRGIDNILGEISYSSNLLPQTTDKTDILLAGNILFRDNLIYLSADSSNTIAELDETNNIRNTGQECEYVPPAGSFNPVVKWHWQGSQTLPAYKESVSPVTVARLSDTNNDGIVDERDVPAIIFSAHQRSCGGSGCNAVVVAVRGDTMEELLVVSDANLRTISHQGLAVGDIDHDGFNEIIVKKRGDDMLMALEHDGTLKWVSEDIGLSQLGIAPSIADLDRDRNAEIIAGNVVLNNDGTIKWTGIYGKGQNSFAIIPLVADLDLDGYPEVVAGNTAYRYDGSVYWKNGVADGLNAIANFDDDPYPEIVLVSSGKVYLLDHTGDIKWGPVYLTYQTGKTRGYGGAPTIADFDGDGQLEIGIAGGSKYMVLKSNGTLLWDSDIQDYSSSVTGSSVFDFDGDGRAEVAYADERYFRIYDGVTGIPRFELRNSSNTGIELPVIADVDNDNRAEIVITATDWHSPSLIDGQGVFGVRVIEDANDNWVNTRKIWNQHTYHITNVNDDGTIPRHEENNWEIYNNYRCNSLLPDEVNRTSDITTSYITIDQTNYPSSVTISTRIGNGGAVSHPAGVEVKFYDGDPLQGGILIGSALTTQVIEKGAYEDVSVVWNTPSEGEHNIYVIADEANVFNECREGNNTSNAIIYLGDIIPPAMPDLQVSQTDITITPVETIEGQRSLIRAIIHNIGTADASNAVVSFYDGDPQNGGMLISSVSVPFIDARADASAEVTWNTFGQRGLNYIHVTADPQNLIVELNENNNSTILSIDVIPPSMPDLAITPEDIIFSHQSPKEGDPLSITVTVHNLGTDAGNITINLYDGMPEGGGTLLKTHTMTQIIPFGEQSQVTFNIDTVGFAGAHSFYILLDPDNTIAEYREDNNSASSDIFINNIGLGLTETTDKTQYKENEDALIAVNVTDLQNELRELIVDVKIFDSAGFLTASLTAQPAVLNPLETKTLNFVWNTGSTLMGDYKATATAYNIGLQPVARYSVPFKIVSSRGILANLVTDKISYYPNETAAIISTISNDSLNQIYENLTATVSIRDYIGQTLYTEDTVINMLTPSSSYSFNTYWNTSTYPPGDYPVTLEVKDVSGNILSTSVKNLTIEATFDPKKLLTGQISVDRQSILQGEPVNITYGITNVGNLALSDMTAEGQNTTSWTPSTGSGQALELIENSRYYWRARAYDGLLYGDWMTPASFRVNLTNEPPTAPTLSSPADDSNIDTLTPLLIVNNASDPDSDNLTYNFELALDIDFTQIISNEIGIFEGKGTTSWQVPIILQENTYYYWRAQADDWLIEGPWMIPAGFFVNTANDAPTAPVIITPSNGSEIISLYTDITVTNSTDPDSENLTYIFEIDTGNTFDSPNLIISGNIPEGQGTTSWHVDNLNDNTLYYVRAKASDGIAESAWSDVIRFFVNATNDAPSIPVLSNPSDGSGVNTFNPELSVHNSFDIDGDLLTYEFELYEDEAMLNLIASAAAIAETPDITSWTSPINLTENKSYYWRARAYDGELYSGWMPLASFMVNTANDAPGAPTLHSPSDGSSIDTLTPALSVYNATDPDSDFLTYDFEVYSNGALIQSITGVPQNLSGITSASLTTALTDNTTYNWRARAYDGDRYGAWMDMAEFSVHLPVTNITGTIDFDPNTLNQKSQGKWVVVYIELPQGYNVSDIIISSILFEGTIPAEPWPYNIGDYDKDGISDLMVKFKRADVINLLPNGDNIIVHVKGILGTKTFEGFDIIRVIH